MLRKLLNLSVVAWAVVCTAVGFRIEDKSAAAPVEPEIVASATSQSVLELNIELEPERFKAITYPVPLDQDLQDHIVQLCEEHHADPCVVFAMIDVESDFQANAIGDNGASHGLMQIQPRWHGDRIERLGVTDLFNPYENVQVGIDYLTEMVNKGNGIEWALQAYNAGPTNAYKGYGHSYAKNVLEIRKTIAEKVNENALQ